MNFILFSVIILFQSTYSLASSGDRSQFYQTCVSKCLRANCTDGGQQFTAEASLQQDFWAKAMFWSCRDECRYHCMWKTVDLFQQRGYQVPKFHGKWPFTRVLGVQEPAAAGASLLNLATHAYMHTELKRRFTFKSGALAAFWHCFYYVCANAWFWSTVFHTRDTPLSEFLDYACALSMIIAFFLTAVVRLLYKRPTTLLVVSLLTLLYFVEHIRYLYGGVVDYDYNMMVNTSFGVVSALLWLAWSFTSLRGGRTYAARMVAFVLFSGAALALELLDFPPRAGWDAHALWHLATAPLPLLFYRFVIDDLNYLATSTSLTEKTDTKLA